MYSIPLLSILVPAYGYAEGIKCILNSLNFVPDNVEIVVFDDTSSDEIGHIVRSFALKIPGLIYKHNPSECGSSLGAGYNWNALLDAAKGEYVILMHHDEVPLEPQFIEKLITILTVPSPPDIVMLDLFLVNKSLIPLRRHVPRWLRRAVVCHVPGYLFRRNVIGPTATLVIRRVVAPRFDPALRWLIDVDFYVKLCHARLRWSENHSIRIGSIQRKTGTITAELSRELSTIDANERQSLIMRYPQYRVWLGAGFGAPIRGVEKILWLFLRGVLFVQSKHDSKRINDNTLIIINIAGGLGNQMFQFACGETLSEITGQNVLYCIDSLSSYNSSRLFELENAFDLKVTRALRRDLDAVIGHWRAPVIIRRFLARPSMSILCGSSFLIEHNFFFMSDLPDRIKDGAYLHGYWQSHKYFESNRKAILNAFQFRDGLSKDNNDTLVRIRTGPSIAIHVRRGDYVSNPKAFATHGVLAPEYYMAGIKRLRAKIPAARIFAFSDDPDWVNRAILRHIDNAECVTHNRGRESFRDMQLMTECNHVIIANSTFSWWAAWLNNNPNKIVIAPKRWFADPKIDESSLIPPTWERI